jgi:hypothetical protein
MNLRQRDVTEICNNLFRNVGHIVQHGNPPNGHPSRRCTASITSSRRANTNGGILPTIQAGRGIRVD